MFGCVSVQSRQRVCRNSQSSHISRLTSYTSAKLLALEILSANIMQLVRYLSVNSKTYPIEDILYTRSTFSKRRTTFAVIEFLRTVFTQKELSFSFRKSLTLSYLKRNLCPSKIRRIFYPSADVATPAAVKKGEKKCQISSLLPFRPVSRESRGKG